jgi:hypothetical protein
MPNLRPTTRTQPTEIDIKAIKGCEIGAVRKISSYDRKL